MCICFIFCRCFHTVRMFGSISWNTVYHMVEYYLCGTITAHQKSFSSWCDKWIDDVTIIHYSFRPDSTINSFLFTEFYSSNYFSKIKNLLESEKNIGWHYRQPIPSHLTSINISADFNKDTHKKLHRRTHTNTCVSFLCLLLEFIAIFLTKFQQHFTETVRRTTTTINTGWNLTLNSMW